MEPREASSAGTPLLPREASSAGTPFVASEKGKAVRRAAVSVLASSLPREGHVAAGWLPRLR